MTSTATAEPSARAASKPDQSGETFDMLIVGAGISGIGAAWHLATQSPDTRFVILETQDDYGGTWRTHRYPGIRSDSDLYTFGYRFKPWTGAPIASADKILTYMKEVIDDNDLARHIRYRHRIDSAAGSGEDRLWHLEVTRLDTGETLRISTRFLWMCQGYYRHSQGYTPEWPGMDRFKGEIVHPQNWPEDIDLSGKRVVVIGSGATAATIVPAIAAKCAHVTLLQRSPTYFITGRNANVLADTLRELDIDETWIHEIVRRKILFDQSVFTRRCETEPEAVTRELLGGVKAYLGEDYDVAKHFTPRYAPWKQRIAFIPDGDLFRGIRSGKASVVTDEIDTYNETGLLLKSGAQLDADVIITATGFNLNVLGDIAFSIDGKPLDFASTVSYRGLMFTGVPNMLWVFGYFRASWTLRVDIVADFICRLLKEMEARHATVVTPALRPQDQGMPLSPWVDPGNFNPGYIMRGLHLMPKQGDRHPWKHGQDYMTEKDELPVADLDDGALNFK